MHALSGGLPEKDRATVGQRKLKFGDSTDRIKSVNQHR
jgi:hypothetical protein